MTDVKGTPEGSTPVVVNKNGTSEEAGGGTLVDCEDSGGGGAELTSTEVLGSDMGNPVLAIGDPEASKPVLVTGTATGDESVESIGKGVRTLVTMLPVESVKMLVTGTCDPCGIDKDSLESGGVILLDSETGLGTVWTVSIELLRSEPVLVLGTTTVDNSVLTEVLTLVTVRYSGCETDGELTCDITLPGWATALSVHVIVGVGHIKQVL
jgi:hypothetical protein